MGENSDEAKAETVETKELETETPEVPEESTDEKPDASANDKSHKEDSKVDISTEVQEKVVDDTTLEFMASTETIPSLATEVSGLSASAPSTSVSPDRKQELLLQARADRLKWIQQVPLPYRKIVDKDDPWNQDKRLSILKASHAGTHLPTAFLVLSQLYGMEDHGTSSPTEVATRIESLLEPDKESKAIPSGNQTLAAELSVRSDDPVLKAYHAFVTQLKEPACSMLVQGMRSFCRNVQDIHDKADLFSKLKAYLASTIESLKSHVQFKKNGVDENVRRSLETFLYGQCHAHLDSVLWDDGAATKEKAWQERLCSLQFVTPTHLEISCLHEEDLDLEKILEKPIEALLSIDLYYSPYEKLQRILALYHGVNAALSEALNQNREDGSQKLPSADDVLPTIILVVLRAKPERLHMDLQLVEDLCLSEYLRGEAGYAYTNLYGAVQFIQDLDLKEPKSLSISPEDFRKGLESCKTATEERLKQATSKEGKEESEIIDEQTRKAFTNIPVQDVRAARQRGEVVDLDWALQWQEENGDAVATIPRDRSESLAADPTAGLPAGFSRTYTFLTTRPEDVKISDLPQLLSEYRMLVHTTEVLIGERAAKASAERKKKMLASQKEIYARASDVDASLLPNGTKSR